MIQLCQYAPSLGLPSPSPFCMKAELLMLMSAIPYTNRFDANVRKAPKAKLPYVVTDDGTVIADSEFILAYLKTARLFTADDWLSELQRAHCLAVTRLIEDHLYWLLVHARWLDDDVWPTVREAFFGGLPLGVKSVLPAIVRNQVKRTLHGQGLGRHSQAELTTLANQDLRALDEMLGDKPFLMGDRICSVDATVYGSLAAVYCPLLDTSLKATALGYPRLMAFCERITERFFPAYRPCELETGRHAPAVDAFRPTTATT